MICRHFIYCIWRSIVKFILHYVIPRVGCVSQNISMRRHRVVQGNTIGNTNCVFSWVRSIDPNCLKTTYRIVRLSGTFVSEFSQCVGYALKSEKFYKEILFLIDQRLLITTMLDNLSQMKGGDVELSHFQEFLLVEKSLVKLIHCKHVPYTLHLIQFGVHLGSLIKWNLFGTKLIW